ncbi:MAG: TonB-dependent receptor [Bacteroidales bacterium]|nr:TonB-dependent receptor [Bacteroidales bacterium]
MKRKALWFIWILLLGGIFYYNVQAQQGNFDPSNMPKNGTITGKVQDGSSNEYVEYAIVSLYKQKDSSLVTGTITDGHGAFSLKELAYGMYYIEASFIGFDKFRLKKVLITPQKPTVDVGDLKIMPAVVNINEVVVTADNNIVEYKIDKKVVTLGQDMTSAGGTVSQALENTPSIEVDIEGNVTLRGSSNFKVLIDGKPSVLQGSDALEQIPASSVHSVEIITNPSAKYDPDGAAGIINLVMKKQKQRGFNGVINASVGTRNKYDADFLLNARLDKTNFFLGGQYSDRSFYNEGTSERQVYRQDTTFYTLTDREGEFSRDGFSIRAGADYYITDKSTVTLQGRFRKRNFARIFDNTFTEYNNMEDSIIYYLEDNNASDKEHEFDLSLDFRKEYTNPLHELKASVFFSQEVESETEAINEQYTDPEWQPLFQNTSVNRSFEERTEKQLRAQIDYVHPFNEHTKFEAGFQSRWDMAKADYNFEDYDTVRNDWITNNELSNKLDYLDAIQSIYGIYTGKLGKFGYQGGLRVEYDNRYINQITLDEEYRYEKLHFFPSFYITRELPKNMQLQLSYSRRIDRPRERDLNPFKDYMDNQNIRVGNPSLSPEFTNSFELNYQIPFKKNLVSFEAFYRHTNNVITRYTEYDTINDIFIHTVNNADKDYSSGGELMANINITRWWLFTLSGNIFYYSLSGENEGEYITRTTTSWGGNTNMIFKLKWDTRIQLMGMYRGPSVTLQGERKGFFFTNFAIRKDFLDRKLSVTLNVRDIFRTGKFSFTSEGSGFYTSQEMRREAPMVMLSLSYRINNYKQKRNGNNNGNGEEIQEMDFQDGGM